MKKKTSAAGRVLRVSALVLLSAVLLVFLTLGGLYAYAAANVDYTADEALFSAADRESMTRLYTKDGEFSEEICLYGYKQRHVPLSDMSDAVKNTFIAAEDRHFYEHHGVDIPRTLYAAGNYITKRRPTFGASTVTQQVVKNISGDDDVTPKRKLTEMLRAFHMEHEHTKDEIFGLYLNIVPMSENLVGIGMASEVYFGVSPSELSYAQAATLAAVANAPTRYNPYLHPEECREKRNHVLYAVMDAGYIAEETYRAAAAEPLGVKARPEEMLMSWFCETALSDVEADLVETCGMTPEAAHRFVICGGLRIETTEEPAVQAALEKVFSELSLPDGLDCAMCICDSQNGDLVAIVGHAGRKTANRGANLAVVPHTPGSALKPLALYAPLLDEKKINAATVFDDVPTDFTKSGDTYIAFPKNSPNVYAGLTTVADALRTSKNTVAVRLYAMRGAENIYRSLRDDFGFDTVVRTAYGKDGGRLTDLAPSPLALGQLTYGVSLRRLTEAYTVFPTEGVKYSPRSYTRVYDSDGRLLLDNEKTESRVFSTGSARVMNQMLSGVVENGTAKRITLKEAVDTAGKTGTSGDDRDRLFVGYTPYYTAGIWLGVNGTDRASVGSIPVSHLEIWDAVMKRVHAPLSAEREENILSFSVSGLVRLPFCLDSGKLYTQDCALDPRGSRLAYAYFTPDNVPVGSCDRHVPLFFDKETHAMAGHGCPEENLEKTALIRVTDRAFPTQVFITDAEYVYRPMTGDIYGNTGDMPYFGYEIPEGVFVGLSPHGKQYNSYCYIHRLFRLPEEKENPSDDVPDGCGDKDQAS